MSEEFQRNQSERHEERPFSGEKMRSHKNLKYCGFVFDGKSVNNHNHQNRQFKTTCKKNQACRNMREKKAFQKPSEPRANVVILLSPEKAYEHHEQGKRSLAKTCITRLPISAPQARLKSKSWRMKANDGRGRMFSLTS